MATDSSREIAAGDLAPRVHSGDQRVDHQPRRSGTGGTQFQPTPPVDVFDFDAAFVGIFRPSIDVSKAAVPTELPVGGGPVTYTYEVRNTGDVPLAGVAARIVDDTCSPVTYVSRR